MSKEEAINLIIGGKDVDTNKISDGYHTFKELYDHRIELFITLCLMLNRYHPVSPDHKVWRSVYHSDGTNMNGWFVMGIGYYKGKQITYHLPISYWERTNFASTYPKAPEWDGHTAQDVLERLSKL